MAGFRKAQQAAARNCLGCGKSFVPKFKKRHQKYCSLSCAWIGTKGKAYNTRISRESAEKRGNAQRGSGEGKTYRKLNGKHEHRVIAERLLGRALLSKEIVHHKDGNFLNNSPGNLAVMTQGEHMREHGIAIPGQTNIHHPSRKKEQNNGRI